MTDTDIDRFLDSMSVLLRTKRSVVSTDTWPTLEYETPKDLLENFSYFQNRATFQRFRSTEPFAFRGKPTATERALWRAAFTRGWNDPRALSRLAEMWAQEPELSDAASLWLFDELTGEDAFGADFGSDPVAELRDQLDALRGLVASAGTVTSCEPMPSFVSRVSHISLHVTGTSGESLNSTLPKDALDGIFDPELGKGWRVRPDGRPVQLDVGFEAPTSVASVRMVVRPVDGAVARARLLARDEHETWLREHLPSEAVVFHTANLPAGATVTLTIDNANANDDDDDDGEKTGIISDFGPARTVFGLDRIALVEATDRTITVRSTATTVSTTSPRSLRALPFESSSRTTANPWTLSASSAPCNCRSTPQDGPSRRMSARVFLSRTKRRPFVKRMRPPCKYGGTPTVWPLPRTTAPTLSRTSIAFSVSGATSAEGRHAACLRERRAADRQT